MKLIIPMWRRFVWGIVATLLFIGLSAELYGWRRPNRRERISIGEQIWQNESRKQTKYLVSWNPLEQFMSLGIGHAIWIPRNTEVPFHSTFPLLLERLRTAGYNVSFLKRAYWNHCPWRNREEFLSAKEAKDPRITKLQSVLERSIDVQADFIIEQTELTLHTIIATVPSQNGKKIAQYLEKLLREPNGWYIIADYTNWRGSGLNKNECAVGYCWGLEYVLMYVVNKTNSRLDPVERFVRAARHLILKACDEKPTLNKWVKGWMKRLETYKKE